MTMPWWLIGLGIVVVYTWMGILISFVVFDLVEHPAKVVVGWLPALVSARVLDWTQR